MSRRVRSVARGEEGAVLVIVTVAMVVILMVAGLVLDVAAVKTNRSSSTHQADSASTAGAVVLGEAYGDGVAACEAAVDYLVLNTPGVSSFPGTNCSSFAKWCDDTTPVSTTTGTASGTTITIEYPVRDDSSLMDPTAIGADTQTVSKADGDGCDRIGVSISTVRGTVFARIFGVTSMTTDVSSVAKSLINRHNRIVLNLLILERYECQAVTAVGSGGGNGGILVDAVLNPISGELDPGYIAVDSDGSSGCSSDGVIDVDGSNAFVRSDGPDGCDGQTGSHVGAGGLTVGEGCGHIQLYAPGVPGCNFPACTSSGTVAPDPGRLADRITRAPIDHRYNCKGVYPFPAAEQIEPCPTPPAPHIDELNAIIGPSGTPPGYADPGLPCTIAGPPGTQFIVPPGNWHISCDPFEVRRDLIFTGGNVVFDGDVVIESSGRMAVNADPVTMAPATDAAIAYFRNGLIRKAGNGSLVLHNTMAYLDKTVELQVEGGAGSLVWVAPVSGRFDDLAMWSESALGHQLSGQAKLGLEGVFFAPYATVLYRGNGAQQQVAAQFVSRKLGTEGQGLLVVRPRFDRAVTIPRSPVTELIR